MAIGPEQGWQRQEAGSKHGVDFALSPEAGLIYNSPRKFQDAGPLRKGGKGRRSFPLWRKSIVRGHVGFKESGRKHYQLKLVLWL